MKTVLVLEDNYLIQKQYEITWRGKLIILQAYSIEQAYKFVAGHPEIDIIVVDACVPGSSINTKEFVINIKKDFDGIMIASSSEPKYMVELVKVGCSDASPKNEVAGLVLKLLKL